MLRKKIAHGFGKSATTSIAGSESLLLLRYLVILDQMLRDISNDLSTAKSIHRFTNSTSFLRQENFFPCMLCLIRTLQETASTIFNDTGNEPYGVPQSMSLDKEVVETRE